MSGRVAYFVRVSYVIPGPFDLAPRVYTSNRYSLLRDAYVVAEREEHATVTRTAPYVQTLDLDAGVEVMTEIVRVVRDRVTSKETFTRVKRYFSRTR